MSNSTNTELHERAAILIDYFENELPARLLEQDLRHNDLEALRHHVNEAWAQMILQENAEPTEATDVA